MAKKASKSKTKSKQAVALAQAGPPSPSISIVHINGGPVVPGPHRRDRDFVVEGISTAPFTSMTGVIFGAAGSFAHTSRTGLGFSALLTWAAGTVTADGTYMLTISIPGASASMTIQLVDPPDDGLVS